jgi:glycosyltransferase involved in cell wall biosynthesis
MNSYRIIYVPGHPAMQYHISRTGHDFYILANWEQFAYWRPKPPNVHDLLPEFRDEHLDYTVEDYQRLLTEKDAASGLNPLGFPERYDLAWSMWNDQYKVFRPFRDLPKVHRVHKFTELDLEDYEEIFSRRDYALASYYQYTVDEVRERFGVTIPLIELGLSPADYGDWTGEDPVILSVIHSWASRGWHYGTYREATDGLPTLHVDHLNPGPGGEPMKYEQVLEAMRRCRVYYHDGENEYTIALVEAMMTGAPIVTCAMPFIERHVQHEVNGFVSDDPKELREYCELLLHDRDLAARMGAASRRIALERFHEDRWIAQWNHLFDEFVAGRSVYL